MELSLESLMRMTSSGMEKVNKMQFTELEFLTALMSQETSTMIFINNKYTKWYYNIINSARQRSNDTYIERHHIVPKSLGGLNTSDNLVSLTAKEHFICHLLLTKMVIGDNRSKMIYAAWQMSNQINVYQQRIKISSVTYSNLKQDFSDTHSKWMKSNRDKLRDKINAYWTEENRKLHAIKISKVTKGRIVSNATKEKHRNKIWTEKAILNLKEIGIKSAAIRKGTKWSASRKQLKENNYYDKNLQLAISVFKLLDTTSFSINKIAKELNVDWYTVKTIILRQEEFKKRIEGYTWIN